MALGSENPAAALEALTAPPSRRVGRFEVRTVTLGLHAVLERIGSPLTWTRWERHPTSEEWAETLFAMTRPGRESARLLAEGRDAFAAAALDWADGVSDAEALALIRAVSEIVRADARANPAPDSAGDGDDAAPEGADPTAATRTAGSQPPPPRPASGSGGPSAM